MQGTGKPAADEHLISVPGKGPVPEHVLGEKARVGRLSRIRQFVFGSLDGLPVPLGVVSGSRSSSTLNSSTSKLNTRFGLLCIPTTLICCFPL